MNQSKDMLSLFKYLLINGQNVLLNIIITRILSRALILMAHGTLSNLPSVYLFMFFFHVFVVC